MVARSDIPDRCPHGNRRPVLETVGRIGAPGTLSNHVKALVVAVWTIGPESLDPAQHYLGISLREHVIAQPKPLQSSRPLVFRYHVRIFHQVQENRLPLLRLQVQRYAPLV